MKCEKIPFVIDETLSNEYKPKEPRNQSDEHALINTTLISTSRGGGGGKTLSPGIMPSSAQLNSSQRNAQLHQHQQLPLQQSESKFPFCFCFQFELNMLRKPDWTGSRGKTIGNSEMPLDVGHLIERAMFGWKMLFERLSMLHRVVGSQLEGQVFSTPYCGRMMLLNVVILLYAWYALTMAIRLCVIFENPVYISYIDKWSNGRLIWDGILSLDTILTSQKGILNIVFYHPDVLRTLFVQGFLCGILQKCPSHHILPVSVTFWMLGSSYKCSEHVVYPSPPNIVLLRVAKDRP